MKIKRDKEIEIKFGDVIKFTPMSVNYGWAYFDICVKFNKGKVTDVWIIPTQQETNIKQFHLKVSRDYNKIGTWFSSWTHQGMEEPVVRHTLWCKEHKSVNHRLSVPQNSYYLKIDTSLEYVDFRFYMEKPIFANYETDCKIYKVIQ